jgi:tetratricopeptide (TPR) repeat protein
MAARFRLATASCTIALVAMTVGCVSPDGSGGLYSGLRRVTPSFLLSEHDRAEKNLKNPASLNVAYGRFQEQVNQTKEARKSYDLALRDDPKSVDAILGLARLDQLAGKSKEAEAGFEKALKMKPGDAAVLAANGQFYASQKRWPEAFDALQHAITAAPAEASYKHQLAIAKTKSGDADAGVALFSQVIGKDKAHYNVAYLLEQEGKDAAASEQCRQALATNPNFEPARMLLDQIRVKSPLAANGRATEHGPATTHASNTTGHTLPGLAYPETSSSNQAGPPASGTPAESSVSASFQQNAQSNALPRMDRSAQPDASDDWSRDSAR